jgi:hypothetical protein
MSCAWIGQELFTRQAGIDLDPPQQLGPVLRACTLNAKPKKLRSAKHSIPLHKAFRSILAEAMSDRLLA